MSALAETNKTLPTGETKESAKTTKIISTSKGKCEYNGAMIDGKANGHGEGIWKKYKKDGLHATYIGLWKNDERCGQGTLTFVFENGLKHEYVGGFETMI